jgi:hypothetical protein
MYLRLTQKHIKLFCILYLIIGSYKLILVLNAIFTVTVTWKKVNLIKLSSISGTMPFGSALLQSSLHQNVGDWDDNTYQVSP